MKLSSGLLGVCLCLCLTGCAALGIPEMPVAGKTPYADKMRSSSSSSQSTSSGNKVEDSSKSSSKPSSSNPNTVDFEFGDSSGSSVSSEVASSSESSSSESSGYKPNPPTFVDKYHIGVSDASSDVTSVQFSDAEKFVRRLTVSDVEDMAHKLELTQIRYSPEERDGFTQWAPPSDLDLFNYFVGRSKRWDYKLEKYFRYQGVVYNYMIPLTDITDRINTDFQFAEFDVDSEEFYNYKQENQILVQSGKMYLVDWPILPTSNITWKLYKSIPLTFSKVRLVFQATESSLVSDTLQVSDEDGSRDSTLALPDGSDTKLTDSEESNVSDAMAQANLSSVASSENQAESAEGIDETSDSSSASSETDSRQSEEESHYNNYVYYPIVEIELSNMDDYKFWSSGRIETESLRLVNFEAAKRFQYSYLL